jgi:hypothetical protein
LPVTASTIADGVRSVRTVCLAALILLTAGCSSTTFLYNRLDYLLPWYVERYVDLDSDQAAFLDAELAPFLAWHREQELPRYYLLLDDIEARLERPLTRADIDAVLEEAEAAWGRLRNRALDWLLALGERLSEAQIEEFHEELEERTEELEEKYLPRDDAEYREDAADRLRDNLEDYLGRLQPQQRDMLTEASQSLIRSDSVWLAERRRWMLRLRELLRREPGWQAQTRAVIEDWEDTVAAEYQRVYEHNNGVVRDALVRVLNARTPDQDERLHDRIDELREDISGLVGTSCRMSDVIAC